jgi:succinate dehydrogenase / fumarate reductase iron-sulfur subunit
VVTAELPATRVPEAAGTAVAEIGDARRFRVFRFKRGDGAPHYDAFDVPIGPRTTLLEALRWIQLERDGTLAMRHSCLHASCGTCGVLANGREVLMCVTSARDLGREITVEPIANVPVLADLVVDMREFYARFPDVHPFVRASESPSGAHAPDGIERPVRYEDCIECGLCLSACPIVATSDRYVGPAALAAAQRLAEEPRGVDTDDVLEWADQPDGVWRCHAAFECTEACPSNVNPAARIMALRGVLVGGRLRLPGSRRT